jgi:hypothetical protein
VIADGNVLLTSTGEGRRRAGSTPHSNIVGMDWYFSMYQRFSLLYFGIANAGRRDRRPSA